MISATDREEAVMLVDETVAAGARCGSACEILQISERTYKCWASEMTEEGISGDKRPTAERPTPDNRISDEDRHRIIEICNSSEYANMPPCEIIPALADQGTYIASESTFYRVLREEKMQNHRGTQRRSQPEPSNTLLRYSAESGMDVGHHVLERPT